MSETGGRWLKGCALGCGGALVLFVLFIVGLSFSMRSTFDEAHDHRQILEERFGDHDRFTPSADGVVRPDRIEAFLTVRDALTGIHGEIEAADSEVGKLDELDANGEPTASEALPVIFHLTKEMMGLPWLFGEIERTRNRALVEADMGLGEYTYLYVIAYHGWLSTSTDETHLFSGSADNRRVRAELRGMLNRQLESTTTEPLDDDGWVETLGAEVAALERDPDRLIWQDGLPERIARSFDPYRDRLETTFSPAAAEFELLNSTIRGGGLSIEMN
jgi:hypothetical protein